MGRRPYEREFFSSFSVVDYLQTTDIPGITVAVLIISFFMLFNAWAVDRKRKKNLERNKNSKI
jgi:hypothetical protein